MNRKAASLVALFALAIAMLLQITSAKAESILDFDLVNKTGYGIKAIYIGPSTSEEWGSNLLKEGTTLENNQKFELKFNPSATAPKWDIKIEWVDGGDAVYWKGFKLSDIQTITLKYSRESGETTAVTE
ncbi:MAG: hypothetical protein ACAI35_06920 [Candidatus Methylacidiphilales bacterium]|nr:hypothetical protein [Candidatus Methylacidiphilales bacterium]